MSYTALSRITDHYSCVLHEFGFESTANTQFQGELEKKPIFFVLNRCVCTSPNMLLGIVHTNALRAHITCTSNWIMCLPKPKLPGTFAPRPPYICRLVYTFARSALDCTIFTKYTLRVQCTCLWDLFNEIKCIFWPSIYTKASTTTIRALAYSTLRACARL